MRGRVYYLTQSTGTTHPWVSCLAHASKFSRFSIAKERFSSIKNTDRLQENVKT